MLQAHDAAQSVTSSAMGCLERLLSKMTYYVSSGALSAAHSLTHSLTIVCIIGKGQLYRIVLHYAVTSTTLHLHLGGISVNI